MATFRLLITINTIIMVLMPGISNAQDKAEIKASVTRGFANFKAMAQEKRDKIVRIVQCTLKPKENNCSDQEVKQARFQFATLASTAFSTLLAAAIVAKTVITARDIINYVPPIRKEISKEESDQIIDFIVEKADRLLKLPPCYFYDCENNPKYQIKKNSFTITLYRDSENKDTVMIFIKNANINESRWRKESYDLLDRLAQEYPDLKRYGYRYNDPNGGFIHNSAFYLTPSERDKANFNKIFREVVKKDNHPVIKQRTLPTEIRNIIKSYL